jgi:hypothetical protein
LGLNGGTGGQITLNGATSGSVALKVAAAAGAGTVFQLPVSNGTVNYYLQTNGNGITSWAAGTLPALASTNVWVGKGSNLATATATTGTGNVVLSASPTLTGTITAAAANFSGNVGIGTTGPRTALDTWTGTMSGAANDYEKAQFTMSGGGTVTWGGGLLKWTSRFIAIPMGQTTASVGYIDINQPTSNIPAGQVYNGVARTASASGVVLNSWEALYAVHTPGGNNTAVRFFIVIYTTAFNPPSNWLLVAAINGDDGSVKLGNGVALASGATWSAGGGSGPYVNLQSATPGTQQTGNMNISGTGIFSGSVGIGTTGPGSLFVVSANTGALPTPASSNVATFANSDGNSTRVTLDAFAGNGALTFRRADTTAASPSAIQSGDALGNIAFLGYGSTAYSSARANILAYASQTWTDSNQGAYLTFSTTANNSTTSTERMRIDNAGNVGIGRQNLWCSCIYLTPLMAATLESANKPTRRPICVSAWIPAMSSILPTTPTGLGRRTTMSIPAGMAGLPAG